MSIPDRVLERLDTECIPCTGRSEDFDWITDAALRAAADNPDNLYGGLLALLAGCCPAAWTESSEARGPTYAHIRAVADAVGMTSAQALEWELLCESIPVAEKHVLHIIGALAEAAT